MIPPGAGERLRSTSYHTSGMPASGTMSRSSAAATDVCACANPSHTFTTLEERVPFFTAPMVPRPLCAIYINRRTRPGGPTSSLPHRLRLGLRLGELGGLDHDLAFDVGLDGVARNGDRPSDAVPVETEVHAVDLALDADAEALLAARHGVGDPALEGRVEHDRLGHVLDRQVAVQAELLVGNRLDAVQLVGDMGVLVGLEEIGRAKVVVTHLGAGVHARNLDLELAGDLARVVFWPFEPAVELVELAANRRYREVLGGETHGCMHLVDFVFDHLVLLEVFGGAFPHLPGSTCLRKQLFQRDGTGIRRWCAGGRPQSPCATSRRCRQPWR